VFVLGGSPDREGAMEWAAKTPNLLNVAASRAKRRLYVIGDHAAWAGRHHFRVLGQHLRRRDDLGRGRGGLLLCSRSRAQQGRREERGLSFAVQGRRTAGPLGALLPGGLHEPLSLGGF